MGSSPRYGLTGLRFLRAFASLPLAVAQAVVAAPARRRIAAQYDDSLPFQVVMVPEPGGPDGWILRTHTPPLWKRGRGGGCVHRACMAVDREGSTLVVICFGRVEEHADPELDSADPARAASEHAIRDFAASGFEWSYAPLEPTTIAGERAYEITVRNGRWRFTEWRFVHVGCMYVAGAHMRRGPDEDARTAEARRVLDTWHWYEAPRAA